jgi:hypothetical protein
MRVRSVETAEQCIRKTLKLHHAMKEKLLTPDRVAELEACCVILMRTKADLWQQYRQKE